MKTTSGLLVCVSVLCFFPIMRSSAQGNAVMSDKFPTPSLAPHRSTRPAFFPAPRYTIPGKRASQYTANDWGEVIDSTWGVGQGATAQQQIFDTFWSLIDQQWSGFPNLSVSWDSIRTLYRPQIGPGLSRGRFFALMSRMTLELLEHHTYIYDNSVESVFGALNYDANSFHYRSGVPLIWFGTSWLDQLGAPVTPMPDSSGLVYRSDPKNPLGLEPGDLILGYEGVPWKVLYQKLMDYGVPLSRYWSWGLSTTGSTAESRSHMALSAVGSNWGMFDTIDVVKYSTGDTLHLSTAPLATYTPSVWATEQVPVAGVPMPQGNSTGAPAISWGVIQGTNIGYVYAWDWSTASDPQLFTNAIYDLRYNKKVQGLVIDFRMNSGGDGSYANGGLSQLFNFDPTAEMSFGERSSASNRLEFTLTSASSMGFIPTASSFDRPIAVLIGPACLSAGDYNAFRMRFHPMARSFGKPTNGAFVHQPGLMGTISGDWSYQIPQGCIYSNVPGEGYLVHKGVQPDEEVWLTREEVAHGKDDVVERALSWITSLAYAHDVAIVRSYSGHHLDSVLVKATLNNPLNHSAVLKAIITDTAGVVRDSVFLYNDGLHGDGHAADSIWGCRISIPADKGLFGVSMQTDDLSQGSSRRLPGITGFATIGPLTLDSVAISPGLSQFALTLYIRNNDSSMTVRGATVTLQCNDPWVTGIGAGAGLPDLPPGATKGTISSILINYDRSTTPAYLNLKAEMSIGRVTYWTDSTRSILTGIGRAPASPAGYTLEQNYPNPFNPTTTIRYALPHRSQVFLEVHNTLGQMVAILARGEEESGFHEVNFDGSGLASGIYFYRLQAGTYQDTKKFVLLH